MPCREAFQAFSVDPDQKLSFELSVYNSSSTITDMKLEAVHVPDRDPNTLYDVEINDHRIHAITPSKKSAQDQDNARPLLLPTLCHPHIHLDKPYLLTSRSHHSFSHVTPSAFPSTDPSAAPTGLPDYSDLSPTQNTFPEALRLTSQAKSRYTTPDLLTRGAQLLTSSIKSGVTSMRAFVEVDHVTQLKCLSAGVQLKRCFAPWCEVQICVFAQDPIFSGEHAEENRGWLLRALEEFEGGIEVLGTTPYVEADGESGRRNIDFAITTAKERGLHLDFHLDYHLDPEKEASVWYVLEALKKHNWNDSSTTTTTDEPNLGAAGATRPGGGHRRRKTVALGHCTRLTLFTPAELRRLATTIHDANLPVSFIGLPTSDLYMMGRPNPAASACPDDDPQSSNSSSTRPRGTLDILSLRHRYDLQVALSVNNAGNAFTPWAGADPLRLASLGVGLYQDGTTRAAGRLFEAVSAGARRAVGLEWEDGDGDGGEGGEGDKEAGQAELQSGLVRKGMRGPFMLVRNREWDVFSLPPPPPVSSPSSSSGLEREGDAWRHVNDSELRVPARQYRTVTDVVWDPPDCEMREVIHP